jgi:hypothetical protein
MAAKREGGSGSRSDPGAPDPRRGDVAPGAPDPGRGGHSGRGGLPGGVAANCAGRARAVDPAPVRHSSFLFRFRRGASRERAAAEFADADWDSGFRGHLPRRGEFRETRRLTSRRRCRQPACYAITLPQFPGSVPMVIIRLLPRAGTGSGAAWRDLPVAAICAIVHRMCWRSWEPCPVAAISGCPAAVRLITERDCRIRSRRA